jgi:chromosomal replication initiator protein
VPSRFALVNPRPQAGGTTVDQSLEDRLEHAIIERINTDRYNLWFRGHTKFVLLGESLVVGVPNLMCQEWLQKTFGGDVLDAARDVAGPNVSVRFAIDPELFRAARAEQERVARADEPSPSATTPTPQPEAAKTRLPRPEKGRSTRKWRSLADFVVGACNRVAHASAVSVVEEPGQGVNPLVIYGPVGTGKTHLLEGVYAGMRRRWPDQAVRYVTAEDFTNAFVASMHNNRQPAFRQRFRDCSVLLLDDLNFLASKKQTQVEFLHTFDALQADHKQVVVTTDCHPRLSEDLLPELVDRLLGGAVWSLLPPDAETRLLMLQAKSARQSLAVPEDVLQFIAQQLRGNVRELEGAVHSLRHFSKVTGRSIDLNLAREALGDLLRHAIRVVGVRDIDAAVCSLLRLPTGSLQEKRRAWVVSHPRMIAIYLCRKHTAATYGEISLNFGNRTHSTAVAAERKVREWLQRNETLKIGEREWHARDLVERIERELGF